MKNQLSRFMCLFTVSICLSISMNAYAEKSNLGQSIKTVSIDNNQQAISTISREVICTSDAEQVIIEGKDISTGIFQKDEALPDYQYLTYLSISSGLSHDENYTKLLNWFKKQQSFDCKVNYIDKDKKIIQQSEFKNLNINNFGEQASRTENNFFETNNIFDFGGDNVVINIDTAIKDNQNVDVDSTKQDTPKIDSVLANTVSCSINDKLVAFNNVIDVGFNLNVNLNNADSSKKRQNYFQFSAPLESREMYFLLVNLFKDKNQNISCDLTYVNKLNLNQIVSKIRYKNLHLTTLTEATFENMDEPFSTNIGLGSDNFEYEILPIRQEGQ